MELTLKIKMDNKKEVILDEKEMKELYLKLQELFEKKCCYYLGRSTWTAPNGYSLVF